MELIRFLSDIATKPAKMVSSSVVVFQGSIYPVYFFYNLIKKLKLIVSNFHIIDCELSNVSQIIALLQTSFLGLHVVYWLKNIDKLSSKKRAALIIFLNNYSGPHAILLYSSSLEFKQHYVFVSLPDHVTSSMIRAISPFFTTTSSIQLEKIVAREQVKINLDELCLVLNYIDVVGNGDKFFDQWFSQMIVFNPSLFRLSQYFFAKKPLQFFSLWAQVGNTYSLPFWVTFWSDQLWKAYFYMLFNLENNNILAQQVSSRLPFSFLQRDWKLYSDEGITFKEAHSFLYSLDFITKNTKVTYAIDLFYSKFFLGHFG